MRDHCLSSISTFSNVEPLDTYSGTPVGSQHFSICKREITMIIETSRHAPALFVATQPGKPKHDLFLTHTKCFLCLNLTVYTALSQHEIVSTYQWGSAKMDNANIYYGNWVAKYC